MIYSFFLLTFHLVFASNIYSVIELQSTFEIGKPLSSKTQTIYKNITLEQNEYKKIINNKEFSIDIVLLKEQETLVKVQYYLSRKNRNGKSKIYAEPIIIARYGHVAWIKKINGYYGRNKLPKKDCPSIDYTICMAATRKYL